MYVYSLFLTAFGGFIVYNLLKISQHFYMHRPKALWWNNIALCLFNKAMISTFISYFNIHVSSNIECLQTCIRKGPQDKLYNTHIHTLFFYCRGSTFHVGRYSDLDMDSCGTTICASLICDVKYALHQLWTLLEAMTLAQLASCRIAASEYTWGDWEWMKLKFQRSRNEIVVFIVL